MQASRKLLIIWPELTEDMLLAVPAAKALQETLGEQTVFLHFAEVRTIPFLSGMFPAASLVVWDRTNLAWHESGIQSALVSLRSFQPDAAICWLHPVPPELQAVIKASGAELRMAFAGACDGPYANLWLAPDSENPLPARFFQFLSLWRYAGYSPQEKWARIQSNRVQRRDGEAKWVAAGAAPEQTWLYLNFSWPSLDDALYTQLSECIRAHDAGSFGLGRIEWTGANENPGEGAWRTAPSLQAAGWSEVLGLIEGARGVIAFQNEALHFASLAEVRCLALLRRGEAAYDVSRWNKLFQITWL